MLINQVARETGVPIHTIRYYENLGLFKGKKDPEVKSNNYSWYDGEIIEKIELIMIAKEIGFTLAEIRDLLNAWYENKLSVEEKKAILTDKIKEVDNKISQLKNMRIRIIKLINEVEEGLC